jgi:hypothetical protein
MKWLLTKLFADEKERASIKLDGVMSSLVAALITRNLSNFLKRAVANIVCKKCSVGTLRTKVMGIS